MANLTKLSIYTQLQLNCLSTYRTVQEGK